MKPPKVSIIIPFVGLDKHVEECIKGCLGMDFKDFEMLLLPDHPISGKFEKSRAFHTGHVKPSVKRNLGISKSRGKYVAFIDSDAYPRKDWLTNALKHLKGDVGAVGGPNMLPPDAGTMEKAGDDVLSSPVGAGSFSSRYREGKTKAVGELPACNLLVRKDLMEKIGKFDTSLLTAEDSKVCFQIRQEGKKILYARDVVVYHHRRKLFLPHLRQMWRYGRDKAVLIKKGFLSSAKPIYFAPSMLVLFLLLGFITSVWPWEVTGLKWIYAYLSALYLLAALVASVAASPRRFLLVFPGMVLTHITYGISFLYGLLK